MQPFFRLKKQNFRCFSMVLMCWCKKKVCKKIIFMHFQLKSISENHYTQHYQINTKLYNIGMTLVKGHWRKSSRGMKVSLLSHSIFKCVLNITILIQMRFQRFSLLWIYRFPAAFFSLQEVHLYTFTCKFAMGFMSWCEFLLVLDA